MNEEGFWFWLGVVANICQLESYEMLIRDSKNSDLMNYLMHQDNDYLQQIIEQNKKIIQLLEKGE